MRLESAVHFCEEVLSGKLYSNQLLIKDGKLMQKADAKIGTIDDTLVKESKRVMLTSENVSKVVLNTSQVPQTKLVRPPTLVSVGTQVYSLLLDNAAVELDQSTKQSTDVVGLGVQNSVKCIGDRSKLHQFIPGNMADSDVGKVGFLKDVNKSDRKSPRVRRKPAKLTGAGKTCLKSKSCVPSEELICHTSTCSDIQPAVGDVVNVTDKNNVVTKTVMFDGNSLEAREGSAGPELSHDDLDPGGKFQCSLCKFSTNNVRKISEHNREHQRANNICYYCERRFGSSVELSVHIDADHADVKTSRTPFVCSSCPAQFRTRTQLVAHLPKHSSARPFICAVCGASFKWRNALDYHAATHTSHKEHLCDICGYATAHRGQLRSHRLVHTGGTMRCSWQGCDFRATRMQSLKYHLLTHTQEKPHQCDVCGQSFSLAKNLKRHMVSHVNSATKHNCSRCTFSTLRYDKLKEHLHRQHKVGSAPERRVRITDLVNLDLAKTVKGSVPQSTKQQSVDASDTPVVRHPVACVADLNITGADGLPEKHQTAIDSSVIVVEPVDFLLGDLQPLSVLTASAEGRVPSEDVTMSAILVDADLVKE